MDPVTGNFLVVANYYADSQKVVNISDIDWGNGRMAPPPDTPPCGFDGSLCQGNHYNDTCLLKILLKVELNQRHLV